jgi:hypothetical protein
MKKLAFMITCFDEVEAIDVALTSLRHYYPHESVTLFCEGDAKQFEHLLFKYNVKVLQATDTQSKLLKLCDQNYISGDFENVETAMNVLLSRISLACTWGNSEYMVLHCPDTLIRGNIEIPDGSGLLGSNVNPYFFDKTNEVLIKYGGIPVGAFGAVPAIFNVEDFKKAKKIINKNPTLLRELAESTCYAFSHDIFMSILFSLIGKREEYNPQIVECGRDPNWMNTNCPIVHQFRTFYPKRKTKYNSQQNA